MKSFMASPTKRPRLAPLKIPLSNKTISPPLEIQCDRGSDLPLHQPPFSALVNAENAISGTVIARDRTTLLEQICVEIYDMKGRERAREIDLILIHMNQYLCCECVRGFSPAPYIQQ